MAQPMIMEMAGIEAALPRFVAPTFEQVYQRYFSFVWHSAKRLGVLDASLDDVCQDVFVAVHRRLAEFQGRSSLKTWVFGFVLNVVHVHHRTQRRKSVAHRASGDVIDPDTLQDARSNGPDERASRTQAAHIAQQLLDRLPPDERAVFVLAEFEGMSAQEIASAVNHNDDVNAVYTLLRAARQQFMQAAQRHRARDCWRLGN